MSTVLINGQTTWSMTRDLEGHREYKITFLVMGDVTDGPYQALNTVGLPRVGSFWSFDNDVDPWAFCKPTATITPKITNEPSRYFEVEFTYSTKADPPTIRKCSENQIENPLLEPQKVSGSFTVESQEEMLDKDGKIIMSSSMELFKGKAAEWKTSTPSIKIEQNVALLQLDLLARLVNTVNIAPLWGLPARTIYLSNISWEKKYYGQCYAYYTRVFEFLINYNTWDRILLDEGDRCLRGDWDRDPQSPTYRQYVVDLDENGNLLSPFDPGNFVRARDWSGEFAHVILDGAGGPAVLPKGVDPDASMLDGPTDTVELNIGRVIWRRYAATNFLVLGIPATF